MLLSEAFKSSIHCGKLPIQGLWPVSSSGTAGGGSTEELQLSKDGLKQAVQKTYFKKRPWFVHSCVQIILKCLSRHCCIDFLSFISLNSKQNLVFHGPAWQQCDEPVAVLQ